LVLLVLSFCLVLGWIPWRLVIRMARLDASELGLIVLNAAFLYGRLYTLLRQHEYAYLQGFAAVALAAVHLGLAGWLWKQPESRDRRPVLLLIGVSLTFVTLAAPIQFTGYRVTMAWALEGAALAWIASRAQSRAMAVGALLSLVLALIRLLSVDSWMYVTSEYPTLANARMLTFLTGAAGMFLASRWLAPLIAQVRGVLLGIYGAGHLVLLWGLGLEVMGWAARTSAPENLRSVENASVSILIAAYAVALAAVGIATRTAINRIFGLALIGFVVLKLYLHDVWELRLIYRVMAFGGLGALLLAMSFLYSRYRSSIESWLQRETPTDADPPG
jgi:uncharacterized membrane protein